MGNRCSNNKYSQTDTPKVSQDSRQPIHKGSILDIKAVDSERFLTCGDDNIIRLHNRSSALKSLPEDVEFRSHTKAVNKLIINGVNVWSASRDLSIRQWKVGSTECQTSIADAHTLNIGAIAMHANNQSTIFSGSRDYYVKGWDVETQQCKMEYKSPRNIVTSMTFSVNNEHLLYQGSEDLCIRVWDTRQSSTQQPALHITGYVYFPLCMDMHSNGYLLATGCKGFNSVGCEVKIWDIRKYDKVAIEYREHTQDVTCCRFNNNTNHDNNNVVASNSNDNNNNILFSCSKDGSIVAWNTKENKKISTILTNKNISAMTQFTNSNNNESSNTTTRNQSNLVVSSIDGSVMFVNYNHDNSSNNSNSNNRNHNINNKSLFTIEYTTKEHYVKEEGEEENHES